MAAYIDLSKKHGHRGDHDFSCGAEFNVKIRRRLNIPNFVREQLSEAEIDEVWREDAERAKEGLEAALRRRYNWVGHLALVGRAGGWLAIEDIACKPRNWDTIGKVVDQHLKNFIKNMESPRFWRDIKGVSESSAPKKSPAQLQREIDEALQKPKGPRAEQVAHATRKTDRSKTGLPVRDDVTEVKYHRPPTASEIRFGHGATHYRTFPVEDAVFPGTRVLKKWIVASDDGLRYYR